MCVSSIQRLNVSNIRMTQYWQHLNHCMSIWYNIKVNDIHHSICVECIAQQSPTYLFWKVFEFCLEVVALPKKKWMNIPICLELFATMCMQKRLALHLENTFPNVVQTLKSYRYKPKRQMLPVMPVQFDVVRFFFLSSHFFFYYFHFSI